MKNTNWNPAALLAPKLLASTLLASTLGCVAGVQDCNYELTQKSRAASAVRCVPDCRKGCYPHDFEKGFRDGYYDIITGNEGCPPVVPPPCYWHPNQILDDHDNRRIAYYNGFEAGVAAAGCQPETHYLKVHTSCRCPLPTEACCPAPAAAACGCQSPCGGACGGLPAPITPAAPAVIESVPAAPSPLSDAAPMGESDVTFDTTPPAPSVVAEENPAPAATAEVIDTLAADPIPEPEAQFASDTSDDAVAGSWVRPTGAITGDDEMIDSGPVKLAPAVDLSGISETLGNGNGVIQAAVAPTF